MFCIMLVLQRTIYNHTALVQPESRGRRLKALGEVLSGWSVFENPNMLQWCSRVAGIVLCMHSFIT